MIRFVLGVPFKPVFSVAVVYVSTVTASETVEENTPLSLDANSIIIHDQLNTSDTLNAGSDVPATKVVANTIVLDAGAETIDLTALVGSNGGAVDMTGLKVQLLKFKAKANNANVITISFGAANPYTGLGAAFSVTLDAGMEFTFFGNEKTADVAGGVKDLDVSGTGAQELDMVLVCG